MLLAFYFILEQQHRCCDEGNKNSINTKMLFEIYLFYAFHLAHQIAKKALRHCIFFLFHLKGNQQAAL